MKRKLLIIFLSVLILSACTLIVPDLFDARIVKVEHLDGDLLAVYLRDAEPSYIVKVNGIPFDCDVLEDDPDILVCTGPSFEPGEELIIEFFEKDGDGKPLEEFSFVVPEIPEELKDQDDDGVPDVEDQCPGNPEKNEPGFCGCGRAETDTDKDGTPDCIDECPSNPEKTKPDQNGCKEGDPDSDGDGKPDSEDKCPDDPDKTKPGVCGCGTPDTDEDKDGITDCEDECDTAYSDLIGDPCDPDEDNDGIKDGADQCPFDSNKKTAGYCGCGESEKDTDKDGTPDCVDQCPKDKERTKPGECGCSGDDCEDEDDDDLCPDDSDHDPVGDPCNHDEDGDTYDDWIDKCPLDPGKKLPGCCGCGVPDVDTDGDGTKDCKDGCPLDPNKTEPGVCGCGVPDPCP